MRQITRRNGLKSCSVAFSFADSLKFNFAYTGETMTTDDRQLSIKRSCRAAVSNLTDIAFLTGIKFNFHIQTDHRRQTTGPDHQTNPTDLPYCNADRFRIFSSPVAIYAIKYQNREFQHFDVFLFVHTAIGNFRIFSVFAHKNQRFPLLNGRHTRLQFLHRSPNVVFSSSVSRAGYNLPGCRVPKTPAAN